MPPSKTRAETSYRPKVLIIGSEDVHARLDLMRGLAENYQVAAAGTSPDMAQVFAEKGFPYFSYPLPRGVGPFADLYAVVALWRLMKRFQPRIVHAFDTKPGVYGCLAARLAGVPVVIGTVTGLGSLYGAVGFVPRLIRGIYEGLQRLASSHADLTIFQNQDDAKEFLARRVVTAGKSALILGSGVSTKTLDPARISHADRLQVRASLGIPADSLLVMMISRVIRSKGAAEFVAAAREIRQRRPGTHFLLVGAADGDSVDRFSTEELAEFGQVVHWPGARKDIPQLLAASDLFVLPSFLREGIPRALLEAAALGMPLITTDTPGCRDVVEDGVNGFLVPARNVAALSQTILSLLDKPDLRQRFGSLSRQRAIERFDLTVVVGQTHRLYQELLARKKDDKMARWQGDKVTEDRAPDVTLSPSLFARACKRVMDVILAGGSLLVLGPLVLLGMLAVKLSSRGPIFYRAKRAGLGGRPFWMLKLRTMRVGTDTADRKITADQDDRVTGVGRWLRKFKIDELPQLWNVLRGDMSIVGPRPEDWDIVQEHYTPQQRRTLEVRPGIASPVDVRWYPDLTYHDPPPPGVPMQEHYLRRHLPAQLAESLRYVQRQTLWLDLQVILQLIGCVLVRSWAPPRKLPLPPSYDS